MRNEMEEFNFRISFKISGSSIDVEKERVRLFEDKEVYLVASAEGENISGSRYLAIQGEGFETYREACIEMLKVEQTLKITALKQHVGISTTNSGHDDYPINLILQEMESPFLKRGIIFKQLISRRAYSADMIVWDPEVSSEIQSINFSIFSQEFAKNYREFYVAFPLSPAIDMLNAIHFEYSSMVRLILSMTVIEMLAGPGGRRSTDELTIIDELVSKIQQSSLDEGQKESLVKAVGGCKGYSIGNSCRKFIKLKLGKEQARKFNDLYDYRSRLVHSGEITGPLMNSEDQEKEIYKSAGEAYILASKLIDVMLEEHRNTGGRSF